MASKACVNRLQKEYKGILKVHLSTLQQHLQILAQFTAQPLLQDPPPNIQAHPSPTNLLEWHYALEGAKGTEYDSGMHYN